MRKADFKERTDGTRYLHLCWQASENGRELEPLKHRKAGDFRDVPVPDMIWDMVQQLPDARCALARTAPSTCPYGTAGNRFGRMLDPVTLAQDQSRSDRHASFFIMARSDRNNFQYGILVLWF